MLYVKAYAKINLFLNISKQLENKYHEYESLIAFLDIFDEIYVMKSDIFKLEIKGEFLDDLNKNITDNYIYKVVLFFEQKYNKKFNYSVNLIKNIPLSSGMGGGSSDCAKMILIINHLWKLNLSIEEMMLIAENFGVDVPVCLLDKVVFVNGIGNKTHNIEQDIIGKYYVLIVNPLIKISTKHVFENFNDSFKETIDYKEISSIKNKNAMLELLKNKQNSLLNSASTICPQILKIIFYLENTNSLLVRMSGSGATCFALYDNKKDLDDAYANIKEVLPNYYIKKTKIINSGN